MGQPSSSASASDPSAPRPPAPARRTSRTPSELSATTTTSNPAHNHAFMLASSLRSSVSAPGGKAQPSSDDADVRLLCEELEDMDLETQAHFAASPTRSHGRASSAAGLRDSHLRFRASAMDPFLFDGDDLWLAAGTTAKGTTMNATPAPATGDSKTHYHQQHGDAVDPIVSDLDFVLGNVNYHAGSVQLPPSMAEYNDEQHQPTNKKLSIIEEVTEATTNHSQSHSHSHTATHFRQPMLHRIASPSHSISSPKSVSPTSPLQAAHQLQAPSSPTLTLPGGIRRDHQLDPQPHNSPGSINSSTLTIRGPVPSNVHESNHTPRAGAPGNAITGVGDLGDHNAHEGDQHLDTSYHQLLQPDYSASDRVSSLGLVGLSSNHGYANENDPSPSTQPPPPPPNHILLDEPTSLSDVSKNDAGASSATTTGLSSLEPTPNSPLAHKSTPASAIGSVRSRQGSVSLGATPFSSTVTPASGRPHAGSATSSSIAVKQPLESPLDHRSSVRVPSENMRRLSNATASTTVRPLPGMQAEAGSSGFGQSSSSSALESLASWQMQVAAGAMATDNGTTQRMASWQLAMEGQERLNIDAPKYDMSAESTPPHQFLPNADLIDNHLHGDQDDDQGVYIHGVTSADFDLGGVSGSDDNRETDRRSALSSDSSIASISLRYKNYPSHASGDSDSCRAGQPAPGTMRLPFITPPGSSGMPSPAGGNNKALQVDGEGEFSMATPDTSSPSNNGSQQQTDVRRPSTPPREAALETPTGALTMTAVRRQLHNRLSAVEDTPMAFQDALASLENIAVPASYQETPNQAIGKHQVEELTPRPGSAAAVQLKLLEMASATSVKNGSPPLPLSSRGASFLHVRQASASTMVRPNAQVGFAGESTTPREVSIPIDIGSSSMGDDESRERISLRIGSSSSSPIGSSHGSREAVLPEPSFAKPSRPASPAVKLFTWAPIPYVMPPDTPAPPRVAGAGAGDKGRNARNNHDGSHPPPSRSPSPPAVAMHPALTQALLALAPNRSLASLASISSLNLSSRSLPSLERLDSVAPHLVSLHAGHNALQFVQGVPSTVRTLVVPMNRLAPLSSFHHLATCLHTLDVSGNLMDDLFPLKCLVNLHSLNADRNGVRKWDKVPSMPALRWLSLRGNHIPEVDGTVVDLPVLHHLYLADNCVSSVVGLGEGMPALQVLNLDNNAIMGPMPGGHPGVVELSALDNMIDLFDARMWPMAKRVELGGNAVKRVELEATDQVEYVGLASQAHMDPRVVRAGGRTRVASGSLAAGATLGRARRESAGINEGMDEETLRLLAPDDGGEARSQPLDYGDLQPVSRLNLSGNGLPSLDQFVHMYQLVHLNLAGCGLRSLPARFARHVPALRVLDLAQNCLQDISSLCKLTRLRWLSLRGNDVADFFHAVGYLAHLTRLEWLDLRQNPLTGLFYPNLVSASTVAAASGGTSRQDAATDDAEWARIDTEYQRSLNDSTVVKRACYRTSLLFHLRASLQVLDRLHISEQERINVPTKYARMEKSLAGIMAGSASGGSMRTLGGASMSTKTSAANTPASRTIGVGNGGRVGGVLQTPSRAGVGGHTQPQHQVPQPPRALTPIDQRTMESPRMRQHPASTVAHTSMQQQQHHPLPVPSIGSNYTPSGPDDDDSDHDEHRADSPPPAVWEGENKSPGTPARSGGSSMQASWVQQYGDLTSETEILREIHQLTASEHGRKPSSPLLLQHRLEQAASSVASPASTVIRPPASRD